MLPERPLASGRHEASGRKRYGALALQAHKILGTISRERRSQLQQNDTLPHTVAFRAVLRGGGSGM